MRQNEKSIIREIAQSVNRPGVYHGRLAEDYDGIGQYALVTLARSSVAAAYKARVAAGDYGTGQIIPVNTPVRLVNIRGRMEIISLGAK